MASDQFDPDKEQAILAAFKDPENAEKAKKELQNIGIKTVQIDRVSRYGGDGGEARQQLINPITGEPSSHAGMILGGDFSSKSARILANNDPAVYAMGGGELISGEDIMLTVVCPKDKTEQAVQTIRSFGGNT